MRDALTIALLPLAAYYVTWVIVHSKIAVSLVERWQFHWESRYIRRYAGDDENQAARMWEGDWHSRLAYLPTCAWCTGFWVSLLFTVTVLPATTVPPWPLWPLTTLGVAAIIGIIDTIVHHET